MGVINKKIVLYSFLVLILAILVYLFMFYMSVIDTKNVKLEGYVFDNNTKKPIENVLVVINNDRYEDDKGNKNYDEYLGHDKITLYTDKNGYYSTVIEKSAFVWVDFEKKGYRKHTGKGNYSSKKMNYEIYLNK
jgi:hypothetical protein